MTRRSLSCLRGRGKFGGGLVYFEVGEEEVEVEDEESQVEWGIEAQGGTLEDYLEGKGRVLAVVWEPNRRSTLQHSRRDCSEVSTTSVSCSCLRRFSVKALHAGARDAGEVGHVNGVRI